MRIFVTGGAGYIGSHTCLELLNAGFDVTVFDNFSNSQRESLIRVEQIAGRRLSVIEGDIRNGLALEQALRDSGASAVVHFAGLKAVGHSVRHPLAYYDHNVLGSMRLLEAMAACDVHRLVFSSSATVYGEPMQLPLTEQHPLRATNPYGQTKLIIEQMLRDLHASEPQRWRIGILRYFNPAGAHESGLIGEDPRGVPGNLMPFVAQVAIGRREQVQIWGGDYDTPDGTGVRDYVHVVDLSLGHLAALKRLDHEPGCWAVNLGTGCGNSVLEMVASFAAASGQSIPYAMGPRRPGDVATCYADATLAAEQLQWRAHRDLITMCRDHWRWQKRNPQGYDGRLEE
ncbi:MAG: UDP-glucose 4-epimerase GalE [Burkholderiaceae bacterium]